MDEQVRQYRSNDFRHQGLEEILALIRIFGSAIDRDESALRRMSEALFARLDEAGIEQTDTRTVAKSLLATVSYLSDKSRSREMASELVRRQRDGAWSSGGAAKWDTVSSALAVLSLSYGGSQPVHGAASHGALNLAGSLRQRDTDQVETYVLAVAIRGLAVCGDVADVVEGCCRALIERQSVRGGWGPIGGHADVETTCHCLLALEAVAEMRVAPVERLRLDGSSVDACLEVASLQADSEPIVVDDFGQADRIGQSLADLHKRIDLLAQGVSALAGHREPSAPTFGAWGAAAVASMAALISSLVAVLIALSSALSGAPLVVGSAIAILAFAVLVGAFVLWRGQSRRASFQRGAYKSYLRDAGVALDPQLTDLAIEYDGLRSRLGTAKAERLLSLIVSDYLDAPRDVLLHRIDRIPARADLADGDWPVVRHWLLRFADLSRFQRYVVLSAAQHLIAGV